MRPKSLISYCTPDTQVHVVSYLAVCFTAYLFFFEICFTAYLVCRCAVYVVQASTWLCLSALLLLQYHCTGFKWFYTQDAWFVQLCHRTYRKIWQTVVATTKLVLIFLLKKLDLRLWP